MHFWTGWRAFLPEKQVILLRRVIAMYVPGKRKAGHLSSVFWGDVYKRQGLIAQVTDEEEIKEMVNNGKATFYIGFDPTADSLHVGHFMALCLMKRLQMAGNKPIALLGGGTGMIGDPSGSCLLYTSRCV